MTIVPIGKINVQVDLKAEGEVYWDRLYGELSRHIREILGRCMEATETRKVDALGRNRVVKVGKRVPILVAQGVWPSTGQQEVIGWVIGAGEDADSWSDLIFQLRQRGVRVKDLQLLIADGSSGLEALRQKKFPQVPFQRCIFHKLKNLWQALQEPQGLEPDQVRTYKRDFLREAAQIWQAPSEREAWLSQKAFCLKWQ